MEKKCANLVGEGFFATAADGNAVVCFFRLDQKSLLMINRDGATTSLWQDSVDYPVTTNTVQPEKIYDVAIVGGGITGLSTAVKLQATGKQCLLLEAQTLCFGTTGGTTAHLNTLMDTPYSTISSNFGKEAAQSIATAARQAIDEVKRNIATYDIECGFSDKDAFLFSQTPDQTKELGDIYQASLDAGIDITYANDIPVPIPFKQTLRIGGQAQFHPLAYCMGLARAFQAMGGVIVQQCRVSDVKGDDILQIETSRLGGLQARCLIFATHIPPGINLLHLRCAPYRSYAMAVTLEDESQYPDALVYDSYDPYHYYRTQEVNGQKYLIAGGEDHKTAHEANTEKCFLQLEAHIRRYFAVKEIAYRWSSQYFEPADGLPYIGHLPGHGSNILVATGFGGNGITYSHVAANCLAALVSGQDHPYPFLDPNRIKPIAGFTNFIKENADVAAQLFKRLIPPEKIDVPSDLAKEEGRIVRMGDETVALYKDAEGTLHAIDPVCTHMKCRVGWNAAEKSWDCPCHGARYSIDGKVLTGPSSRDLPVIHLEAIALEEERS